MNGDLKLTFIQNTLAEYMQDVMAAMRIAAARAKVGVTEEGIKSLSYVVLQQGQGAAANLSFKEYLRFVDMGVGRGHPLGGLKATKITLQKKQSDGRKPKKIYSRIVYGKLTGLETKLLFGYTEETIAMLKSEMQN